MPFLQLPSAHLYYEIQGEQGPWITLVNGHTRSSRDFRLLGKSLASAGFRCLTLDNRGSGQTQSDKPFSVEDMVQDIAALWDAQHIDQTFLLGISMGGMLSQILAARYPAMIRALILVSTGASTQDLSSDAIRPWGATEADIVTRLLRYFTPDFYARNKLLVQAMAKQILHSIQEEAFETRAQEQRQAIQNLDNRDSLSLITAPVLILHGAEDAIIPPRAAKDLAAAIPQAELVLLPGVGHLLLAEDSKGLGERVLNFTRRWVS
jgi:3-oxoadipate enol-lactonase